MKSSIYDSHISRARIFQEGCIREYRAKKFIGRNLIYGIRKCDLPPSIRPHERESWILKIHNWVWVNQLTNSDRKLVSSKWMASLVRELCLEEPGEDDSHWKTILKIYRPRLGSLEFRFSKRELKYGRISDDDRILELVVLLRDFATKIERLVA